MDLIFYEQKKNLICISDSNWRNLTPGPGCSRNWILGTWVLKAHSVLQGGFFIYLCAPLLFIITKLFTLWWKKIPCLQTSWTCILLCERKGTICPLSSSTHPPPPKVPVKKKNKKKTAPIHSLKYITAACSREGLLESCLPSPPASFYSIPPPQLPSPSTLFPW